MHQGAFTGCSAVFLLLQPGQGRFKRNAWHNRLRLNRIVVLNQVAGRQRHARQFGHRSRRGRFQVQAFFLSALSRLKVPQRKVLKLTADNLRMFIQVFNRRSTRHPARQGSRGLLLGERRPQIPVVNYARLVDVHRR